VCGRVTPSRLHLFQSGLIGVRAGRADRKHGFVLWQRKKFYLFLEVECTTRLPSVILESVTNNHKVPIHDGQVGRLS